LLKNLRREIRKALVFENLTMTIVYMIYSQLSDILKSKQQELKDLVGVGVKLKIDELEVIIEEQSQISENEDRKIQIVQYEIIQLIKEVPRQLKNIIFLVHQNFLLIS
jgi:hypothetical protein